MFISIIMVIIALLAVYGAIKYKRILNKYILLGEVIEVSAYSIALINKNCEILYYNKKLQQTFGIGEQDSSSISLKELCEKSGNESLYIIVSDFIKKHYNCTKEHISLLESNVQSENSKHISYFLSLRPFYSEVLGDYVFSLVLLDAHPEHIQSQHLRSALFEAEKSIEELKNVDKLKSEFLAICSHELKTPLVSIKGYLDLIYSKKLGDLTERQEKALRISLKNADQLNELISSMLNFARMEAGKLDFYFAKGDIKRLVLDAADSLKPIADKKNIEFEILCESDLTDVVMDYGLINRVMLNLMENSVKFSYESSKIIVSIQDYNENLVKITVKDFGCGIPDKELLRIKMPFVQVETDATCPRKGLGLGLSICEKILEGHETSLTINSEIGKGTEISFYLKVALVND